MNIKVFNEVCNKEISTLESQIRVLQDDISIIEDLQFGLENFLKTGNPDGQCPHKVNGISIKYEFGCVYKFNEKNKQVVDCRACWTLYVDELKRIGLIQ